MTKKFSYDTVFRHPSDVVRISKDVAELICASDNTCNAFAYGFLVYKKYYRYETCICRRFYRVFFRLCFNIHGNTTQ